MKEIDTLPRIYGSMSTFCECIACGAKNLALGAPVTAQERDVHWEYALEIAKKRNLKCAKCDDALLTDLFPWPMNKGKHNIIFYAKDEYLEAYEALKQRKKALVASGEYHGRARYQLAYDYGKLLSYSDEAIHRMIAQNTEKEVFGFGGIPCSAMLTFLYFDNLPAAYDFFENTMGFQLAVNQGDDYCHIYKVSNGCYVGCVDRSRGSVAATSRDGVLVSFVVDNMDEVYPKLKQLQLTGLTQELHVNEQSNIKSVTFIGPEGYKFEVEEFLDPSARQLMY